MEPWDARVIIADGWLGTDDVIVDLKGRGTYLKKQFVARAIADADAVLVRGPFQGASRGRLRRRHEKPRGGRRQQERGKMNLHGATGRR